MKVSALALLFGFTMFVAALLLFAVQPMIGKMVLPILGGTPGVWNTCLVFFQSALLTGYAYAHLISRKLSLRKQFAVHGVLFAALLLVLPISVPTGTEPPGSAGLAPAIWLFGILVVSAGVPFFVVATTAPLMQRWFSWSGHPRAHDPYFLYAASNAGSLAGLVCYPWVVEPSLALSGQSWAWALGCASLGVLVLGCGTEAARRQARGDDDSEDPEASMPLVPDQPGAPSLREAAWWVALAFIPSSWLLGVTTYITTDLAAIPLLWTVPLGIYMVTFILAFARGSRRVVSLAPALLPLVVVPLVMVLAAGLVQLIWMPLHLAAFFVGAMVCHGQLATLRPPPRHATAFYLAIALGGVLGGAFNALLAPLIFDRLTEYPLAVIIACLASPGAARPIKTAASTSRFSDLILPAIVAGLTTILVLSPHELVDSLPGVIGVMLAAGLGLYTCVTGLRRPVRFALTAAGVLLASGLARDPGGRVIHRQRDFYGTLRVLHDEKANVHRLLQGNTLQGQQSRDPSRRGEPSTYFTRSGPIGQVFTFIEQGPAVEPGPRVGVIGLGAGTLACYARAGEAWTFYELDPAVVRLADDSRFFTYLADCRARGSRVEVILGDARRRLREAPEQSYELLVLDVFSSDSIPVHLLSREAIRLYQSKLSKHGLLALNITNRYLDLDPLLGLQAAGAGLVCRICYDVVVEDPEKQAGKQPSIWAVLARSVSDLGDLATDPWWREPRVRMGARVWTDDYSDLASYLVLGGRRFPARSGSVK